jgi:hypothetical protein
MEKYIVINVHVFGLRSNLLYMMPKSTCSYTIRLDIDKICGGGRGVVKDTSKKGERQPTGWGEILPTKYGKRFVSRMYSKSYNSTVKDNPIF